MWKDYWLFISLMELSERSFLLYVEKVEIPVHVVWRHFYHVLIVLFTLGIDVLKYGPDVRQGLGSVQ